MSPDAQSHQPLLDLPRHIRLRIYSHALEPFLMLMLTQREHIMETRPQRRQNTGTVGICLPARDPRDTGNDGSWDQESSVFKGGPQRVPTLGYRVSTYSPLLLVNRQISTEVRAWIDSSGLPSSVHGTVRKCIAGDTVDPSNDPDFLLLVESSRLVLSMLAEPSLSFLQRLPSQVRSAIHSVVFHRLATLFDDGPTRLAWSKKKTERYAAYTEALRRSLPNLRDVAVQIPISGFERDMFCASAATELADMLLDGMVDTMRLLYDESDGTRLLEEDLTLETIQATECLACGKRQSWMGSGVLKRCARCLKAFYCSPACQKTDWKSHRAWCTVADEAEKSKPQRNPRLPRFDAVLEEHVDADSGRVLVQTASFPRNQWETYKTVIALRRTSYI